jgi:hypothetical protein
VNAIQRLKLGHDLAKAMNSEDIPKMCELVGMNDPMFDELPVEELMEILTVRLYNTLKEIGVIKDERQD